MTALELIKKGATLLNVKEILEDENLNNVTVENQEECIDNNFALNRFFEILKIMLNDIASDYAPIIKEKTFISNNKVIDLNEIENLLKVCNVSIDKVPVKHKIVNKSIVTNFDGVFTVKYSVLPKLENLLDDIDVFDRGISMDLLINGMLSLYCLAVGLLDEFEIYNDKYNKKLSALKNFKIIDMPCRRWE